MLEWSAGVLRSVREIQMLGRMKELKWSESGEDLVLQFPNEEARTGDQTVTEDQKHQIGFGGMELYGPHPIMKGCLGCDHQNV